MFSNELKKVKNFLTFIPLNIQKSKAKDAILSAEKLAPPPCAHAPTGPYIKRITKG